MYSSDNGWVAPVPAQGISGCPVAQPREDEARGFDLGGHSKALRLWADIERGSAVPERDCTSEGRRRRSRGSATGPYQTRSWRADGAAGSVGYSQWQATVAHPPPSGEQSGASSMVWLQVEVVGDADEVVRFLGCLGGTGGATVGVSEGEQITAPGPAPAAGSRSPPSGVWTEELAADFTASLDVAARRMLLRVWRAGASGIHRRALGQQLDLSSVELRSLLTRTSNALRRFRRERGLTLARPVVSNSPLQSYFVDPEFAAVVESDVLGEGMGDRLAGGA